VKPGGEGVEDRGHVKLYRDAWVTVTTVVACLGTWGAVVHFTVSSALATFFCVAVLGGCVLMMVDGDEGRSRRDVLGTASLIGVGGVAVSGLLVLWGPAGWLTVLVLWGLSPRVVRWARGQCRRWSPTAPAGQPKQPAAGRDAVPSEPCLEIVPRGEAPGPRVSPAELGLAELCWAWRRSYVRLQRCRSVHEIAQVVTQRQQVLDELERRNPGGLSAWLDSGARAAGDPTRYVTGDGPAGWSEAA